MTNPPVWIRNGERWEFVRQEVTPEGGRLLYARKAPGQFEPDWAEFPLPHMEELQERGRAQAELAKGRRP